MYIIAQKENCWFDSRYVTNVSGGDHMVFVGIQGVEPNQSIPVAYYDNSSQTAYAAMLCLNAMLDNEQTFQFPHKDDLAEMMYVAHCHRSKFTCKKNAHGGS